MRNGHRGIIVAVARTRWRHRAGRAGVSWLVAAIFGVISADVTQAGEAKDCPDIAGHYRVDGFGPVLGDALDALDLRMAGFSGSEVKIAGRADIELRVWIKSGTTGVMPSAASLVLRRGESYDCANGSVVLKRVVASSRQSDAAWLEGSSTVRLASDGRGGLSLSTEFYGRQRSTIFSYDSARVSIPKLGTAQTLAAAIRWPNIREPRPPSETYVPIPEAAQVITMRQTLDSSLLGGVTLGGLQDSGGRVLASLSAQRSEDILAFEDRLRDAGIAYDVKRSPIWTNNQYYMQVLFGGTDGDLKRAWHPSEFRVLHEIEKIQHPMVSVSKVEDTGDTYIATLDVIGSESTETILKRLHLTTTMFSAIEVLDDTPHATARNLRIVRLRLTLQ